MSKLKNLKWIKRKKTETEVPYQPPVWLGDLSNGEYYLPQGDTVVLGGTAEPGREHLTPDPGTAEAIVRRCARIEPRLAGTAILQRRVGIRPTTPTVRVERDRNGIIHNYGHGGSGLTLSWGCAADVLALLEGSSRRSAYAVNEVGA